MSTDKKNGTNKSGGRSWASVLLVLFSATACAFAGYLVWEMKAKTTDLAPAETTVKIISEDVPHYFPMNTFTVSLKPTAEESERVLYVGFSVQVADEQSASRLEKYLPIYRSRMLMLFTQLTYEELSTDEGKLKLIQRIKDELSRPVVTGSAIQPVEILINEFILR
ncbi:flagellar FliL protein [Pantoea agglomerans]|jgi:flagellar FliL protein|uniref:flagellar basal body-associated FliL family protein n=1 Tax=Enterobacter agglomerans TaxID=549 RepID=UPI0010534F7B|nr:flagellar basal body-associated FliL family protein [Pantoea agglomerans]MDQ0431103.1 flagellar FliL protein [Pantoea agglomerans]NEG84702.1 flagellar basal body-associated protein FliL [Pantoea agglomerans]NEH06843.1 flagellar basal body-associated protein FliL [Pantoea agglomerans]TCZ24220.1 flagellar basal body-associated protein FliL [Pantoea agglomerans]